MIKTICSNTDISHSSGTYFSLNFGKQQSLLKEMFQDFLKHRLAKIQMEKELEL